MLIFNHLKKTGVISSIISNMKMEDLDPKYINVSTATIANRVDEIDFTSELKFYRTKWPWSKAYAKTYKGRYNAMYLNSRKLNRPIESLVGTITHEWGHLLESFWRIQINPLQKFNHGDNNRKDDTFQYMLGRRAKAYVKENRDELLRTVGAIV